MFGLHKFKMIIIGIQIPHVMSCKQHNTQSEHDFNSTGKLIILHYKILHK